MMCLPRSSTSESKSISSQPADIASGDLSRYDVILLGVRTYAARPELATYNNRLLDYVKNGGVVIVQYNTPEFDHNFGPYPYTMTSNPEEVTDEASKVQILAPGESDFQLAEQNHGEGFPGLGRGARLEVDEDLGRPVAAAAGDARPGPAAAERRPALRKVRQGHLRLQRVRVLSPAAGRRAGRLPHFRESDQPAEESAALSGPSITAGAPVVRREMLGRLRYAVLTHL